jgi:nicotinate-nucleotide adenylyltransferase
MRIGILGGSFDPPHLGHLHVARCARDELALDVVRLIPAAIPPHKRSRELADGHHRLAMLALAARGQPWLAVDASELERGGTSYTFDTLATLKAACRSGDALFFLIGSDSLVDLPDWHRAHDLVDLATFVTVPRDAASAQLGRAQVRARFPAASAQRILAHVLDAEMLPISSSQIRARVRAGQPIVELVPAAVADYIERTRLYRDGAAAPP